MKISKLGNGKVKLTNVNLVLTFIMFILFINIYKHIGLLCLLCFKKLHANIKNDLIEIRVEITYKTNSLRQEGPANNIRGQKHRLVRQYTGNCHQRENFFLNRVVPFWNQLPLDVIDSNSTNMFKNRYDKFIKSSKNFLYFL